MAKENKSPVSKKVEDIKPEDKRKALETALTQIKKQFGEGAVMPSCSTLFSWKYPR